MSYFYATEKTKLETAARRNAVSAVRQGSPDGTVRASKGAKEMRVIMSGEEFEALKAQGEAEKKRIREECHAKLRTALNIISPLMWRVFEKAAGQGRLISGWERGELLSATKKERQQAAEILDALRDGKPFPRFED